MAKRCCLNGHVYDADIYGDACPFCSSEEGLFSLSDIRYCRRCAHCSNGSRACCDLCGGPTAGARIKKHGYHTLCDFCGYETWQAIASDLIYYCPVCGRRVAPRVVMLPEDHSCCRSAGPGEPESFVPDFPFRRPPACGWEKEMPVADLYLYKEFILACHVLDLAEQSLEPPEKILFLTDLYLHNATSRCNVFSGKKLYMPGECPDFLKKQVVKKIRSIRAETNFDEIGTKRLREIAGKLAGRRMLFEYDFNGLIGKWFEKALSEYAGEAYLRREKLPLEGSLPALDVSLTEAAGQNLFQHPFGVFISTGTFFYWLERF